MEHSALILFAHGARDPEWAAPLHRVREALHALAPAQRVELAFLEFMTPGLEACAHQLASAGYTQITVVPMFIAQGGHLKRDVPLLMDALRTAHPGCAFALTPPVGEAEAVIQAMAGFALSQAQPS